jgi:hypothetical protein
MATRRRWRRWWPIPEFLQEAVIATNNDPGTWNIGTSSSPRAEGLHHRRRFRRTRWIVLLNRGNVTINGDIDGGGQPDITVASMSGDETIYIFSVISHSTTNSAVSPGATDFASSNNRLADFDHITLFGSGVSPLVGSQMRNTQVPELFGPTVIRADLGNKNALATEPRAPLGGENWNSSVRADAPLFGTHAARVGEINLAYTCVSRRF